MWTGKILNTCNTAAPESSERKQASVGSAGKRICGSMGRKKKKSKSTWRSGSNETAFANGTDAAGGNGSNYAACGSFLLWRIKKHRATEMRGDK